MGKFNPTVFFATIIIVGGSIFGILAIVDLDGTIGLDIPPPELRTVGTAGRGTVLSAESLGLTEDPIITVVDENGNETEVSKEQIEMLDQTATMNCDEPMIFIDGKCQTVMINGSEVPFTQLRDTIGCWLQTTVKVLDSDGNIAFDNSKSDIFKLNPKPTALSLIDSRTGLAIDKGGFIIIPTMKCASSESGGIDPEGLFGFLSYPSVQIPLRLQSTQLTVRVYSENPEGNLVDTFQAKMPINRIDIDNTDENKLGELTIRSVDLLKHLPEGMYESTQNIVLEGRLVLGWNTGTTADDVAYTIPLLTTQRFNTMGDRLSVFNELLVQRDIDVDIGDDAGNGDGNGDREQCTPPEVRVGQLCVTPEKPDDCGANAVFVAGLGCVKQGENPDVDPNIVDKFLKCLETQADGCLLSAEFVPFYIITLGGFVFIGAIAQRNQPQVYGVPRGGF